jgi:hypothetical protein
VDSAEFLIGVSDRGEIRFIFQQRSSADPNAVLEAAALDAEAANRLALVKLKPGGPELTWGRARIDWGAEFYQASAPPKNSSGTKARP